jgi:hypothetical protein
MLGRSTPATYGSLNNKNGLQVTDKIKGQQTNAFTAQIKG